MRMIWRALLATIVAAGVAIGSAVAQTPSAPPVHTNDATLWHSALKATTFKVAATLSGWFIYTAAAGTVAGGTALTAFTAAGNWLLYTVNDYLWDTYSQPQQGGSFDKGADAWRTTKKYLTYKPSATALALGSVYIYTGSVTTVLQFGVVMTVWKTALFYANNFAWDYYDWYVGSQQGTAQAS
jgi:uncharacterized membrane protein